MSRISRISIAGAIGIAAAVATLNTTHTEAIVDRLAGIKPQKPVITKQYAELTEIPSLEEYRAFISNGCAAVEYGAPWCLPCQALKKDLAEYIARKGQTVPIGAVDLEASKERTAYAGIHRNEDGIWPVPQLIIYEEGTPRAQFIGYKRTDLPEIQGALSDVAKNCQKKNEKSTGTLDVSDTAVVARRALADTRSERSVSTAPNDEIAVRAPP